MFPLPLIPTVPDDLAKMNARRALPQQNSFMKNALIRALNGIYEYAPRASPAQPAFGAFMEYIEIVCDMTALHIQGDEIFSNSLSSHCKAYQGPSKRHSSMAQNELSSFRRLACDWKKNGGKSYQASQIHSALNGMEGVLIEVLHKQVPKFTEAAVPASISDEQMLGLITDNMVWLTSNSEICILLPFCMAHHDVRMSKYWPPVNLDAIQAMPELVEQNKSLWKFSPFDPISRRGQKPVF
ncbi:hypothetical protein HYPSUDRAFT_189180 [Hypholoma sublateritium FD-334 SS-4]|uniref:Uncharacterized protein n=1 Tax=Hypholoma sublateritium (strain FD-334 SS-4) TaxID=945553 RepID=A0A0D2NMB9_HYPSF|nr:hypothetical protein HYPSUDRAFT_189180 [Hypholoma sublateritium FD-334 SS-4]